MTPIQKIKYWSYCVLSVIAGGTAITMLVCDMIVGLNPLLRFVCGGLSVVCMWYWRSAYGLWFENGLAFPLRKFESENLRSKWRRDDDR